MSQSFARVRAMQVQYQLACLFDHCRGGTSGAERVDAGAVDQAAHRVHLLSACDDDGAGAGPREKADPVI
jgi:hypothetical protein